MYLHLITVDRKTVGTMGMEQSQGGATHAEVIWKLMVVEENERQVRRVVIIIINLNFKVIVVVTHYYLM